VSIKPSIPIEEGDFLGKKKIGGSREKKTAKNSGTHVLGNRQPVEKLDRHKRFSKQTEKTWGAGIRQSPGTNFDGANRRGRVGEGFDGGRR